MATLKPAVCLVKDDALYLIKFRQLFLRIRRFAAMEENNKFIVCR